METYTNSFGADWHLSGNALAGALPVMLLGHFIAANKERFLKLPGRATVLLLCGCHPSALIERIGRADSLYIYLFHFLIIRLLRLCLQNAPVEQTVTDWCLPVAVIVLSVLLAELIVRIKGEAGRK